jgi:hypothetical protein
VRDEEHHRRTVELFLPIVSPKSETVVFQFSTLLQRMECCFELRPMIPLKQGANKTTKRWRNLAVWVVSVRLRFRGWQQKIAGVKSFA